jgi:hypothetical protein
LARTTENQPNSLLITLFAGKPPAFSGCTGSGHAVLRLAFALYWANPMTVSAHLGRLLDVYRAKSESACGAPLLRPS